MSKKKEASPGASFSPVVTGLVALIPVGHTPPAQSPRVVFAVEEGVAVRI